MLKLILIIGWSLILKWENVIIVLSNKSLLLNPKLGLCVWDKVGAHRGWRKCIYEREVCLIKWRTLMWGDNFCSQSSSFSVIISAKSRPNRAWYVWPLKLTFLWCRLFMDRTKTNRNIGLISLNCCSLFVSSVRSSNSHPDLLLIHPTTTHPLFQI